jgi:carbamoyl-phosphate synthase small subunit
MSNPSRLVLSSGQVFSGFAPSWQKENTYGEVVFSTGMTGYVESLTDPSYKGQILTFTYPLIGNYGVPSKKYWESETIQVQGIVVGSVSDIFSHHTAQTGLLEWLQKYKIPIIYGVDTRALTKYLRKQGSCLGGICCNCEPFARSWKDPNTTSLVQHVSPRKTAIYQRGKKKIICVDCGIKHNMLRLLSRFDVTIQRVPYNYDYTQEDFDALFISNGPGDPAIETATVAILQKALQRKKPTFGICLGAQLLALAIGAKTYKLTFGHRGHNVPCYDIENKRCILTAQNHGWAIESQSLPQDWTVTFTHSNDQSVEGIAHKTEPFSAVQFHPESTPGPNDAAYLMDRFYDTIER